MSALYNSAKQSMLSQSPVLDLDTDVIKIRLLNIATDYTFSATDASMTPVIKYSGTTDQTLGSITVTNGVFDAADAVFTAVAISGVKTVGGLAVFKFVTNDAGSFPVAYIDGFTAVSPNGGNITVQFDNGSNRIFAL